MFQVQLINTVVEWERRLQIEEERRNNLKGKPYEDATVTPNSSHKERKASITRIFQRREVRQPARYSTYDGPREVESS